MSGTVPQVLAKGVVSKAADCFSFGVLLWEMASGARAWAGLTHPQIMLAVALQRQALTLPPETPPPLAALAAACMAHDPHGRPTFREICAALAEMRAEYGDCSDERLSLDGGPRALSCPA